MREDHVAGRGTNPDPAREDRHGHSAELSPSPATRPDLAAAIPPEIAAQCPKFVAALRAVILTTRARNGELEHRLVPTAEVLAWPVGGEA